LVGTAWRLEDRTAQVDCGHSEPCEKVQRNMDPPGIVNHEIVKMPSHECRELLRSTASPTNRKPQSLCWSFSHLRRHMTPNKNRKKARERCNDEPKARSDFSLRTNNRSAESRRPGLIGINHGETLRDNTRNQNVELSHAQATTMRKFRNNSGGGAGLRDTNVTRRRLMWTSAKVHLQDSSR